MKNWPLLLLLPVSVCAHNYQAEPHVDPWQMEGMYRQVAPAKFYSNSVEGTKVNFADALGAVAYSHFVSKNNCLSGQLGYNYMKFDWKENPRFNQTHFNLANASIAWISHSVYRWRWIFDVGASVNADTLDFPNSGVYSGLLWGRYHHGKRVGLHVGVFGFTGVHTTYIIPVIGLDWRWTRKLRLHAIFPFDFSLTYAFAKHWSSSLGLNAFGGPYHYPWRVNGGSGQFRKAIFEVHATGLRLSLDYKWAHLFSAGLGAGCNFGGWILIRDHEGHHGRYYKYNPAPYAQAHVKLAF